MSRSWKQENTRDKKVYLGLHTPLQVNNITTSGTTEFDIENEFNIENLLKKATCRFTGNTVSINSDASFQGSIRGVDASFQQIGASGGNTLKIVDDVSFQGSIHCVDASFQQIGASDGNTLKIVDDVSFQGSIACTDVSFQRIGTIHGLSLEVADNVFFNGSFVANRASFASATPYSRNKITFTDTKFDLSNSQQNVLISDVVKNIYPM